VSKYLSKHPLLKALLTILFKKPHPIFVRYPMSQLSREPLVCFVPPEIHPIFLDYPVNPQPRYGYHDPPHPKLYEIINKNRSVYADYLTDFLKYKDYFIQIPKVETDTPSTVPAWVNGWLPGLDAVSLYALLCLNNPKQYLEIGSGYSTKFARRAITDHRLRTKITSIDPHPRAEIDSICDDVIRRPIEDVDLAMFDTLEAGDILFVDHSHRVFTNSDATVVFLDILPKLKQGVFVELHDIFLPFDYPPEWEGRYYSEQYLLASYLLAEGSKFDVVLANAFISNDSELNSIMAPLWEELKMDPVGRRGASFWIKIKS